MGFWDFVDNVVGPPPAYIRELEEKQRRLDESYRQYKGPATQ